MRRPGLEPGSVGWKPTMLTPTPTALLDNRTRTSDLRNYSPPLYQLSYIEIRYQINHDTIIPTPGLEPGSAG